MNNRGVDRDRYRKIKDLFNAALDLPADKREAYFAQAAGGDDELLREVRELLDRASGIDSVAVDQPRVSPSATSPSLPPIMTLAAGSHLGPYTIRGELGQGGMGVVYAADDPRLKRQVAIKLLQPDRTRDDSAKQRFRQEAQAASALDHANICTIYEINETADGQLYLVMAYYEGETLKQRIARGAPALDEAVDIAIQVGRGLAELIARSGVVKILDFGLAKLAGSEGVTQTGVAVGTLAYMSPEQARGDAVDHRTDIWSLGVVLYEMLSGQQPFRGDNLLAIADAIRRKAPASLKGDASSASGAVTRALSKNTETRYQAVAALVDDLQSATTSAIEPVSHSDVPSIAVLPFQLLSAGDDASFLSVALAEAVAHGLSQNRKLAVRPTSAVMRYVEHGIEPLTVASELNVRYVVEGSIQKQAAQLRVHVQAWDAVRGCTVLSVQEDGREAELFELQDRIAEALVREIGFETEDPPAATPPTSSPSAYELYLRANSRLLRYSPRDTRDAIDLFRAAVRADPRFSAAWARLATALVAMGALFDPDPQWYQHAEEAVARALRLDPSNPEAWVARGRILWSPHRDFCHSEALRELERARAHPARPHDAPLWEGIVLVHIGLHDEARVCLREALDEQPDDIFATVAMGEIEAYQGNHAAAQEHYERILTLEPSNAFANTFFAIGLLYLGRLDEAERAIASASELVGEDSWLRSAEALLWAKRGEPERADEQVQLALANMQSISHMHHTRHYLAAALATLGQPERAIAQVREAAKTGLPNYPLFLGDPHLDSVRAHAAGAELLASLKQGWEAMRLEFGRSTSLLTRSSVPRD